ncbi:MAG: hypothetical protein BRC58_03970 [Cyanobacteria bacterium QS_8_64_29]|nr:MAG: hypothetical protein BRC58_03970 [Cyanobacteria bacterium QS_8_64_29]
MVAGTSAAEYLRRQPVRPIPFERPEAAYWAVAEGQVPAMFYDAPTLAYRAARDGKLRAVGERFARQQYGIALPPDSPRQEAVNRTLLQLQEAGALVQLQRKWFRAPE